MRVDLWEDASPLHFFLCDAANTDGSPWDACPRTLLKVALSSLEVEMRLRLVASFEQEFVLDSPAFEPGAGFSFEAQRLVEPFAPLVFAALRQAGLEPETFLPEYGSGQYEIPCAPAEGVAAADRPAAMREVVREVALAVLVLAGLRGLRDRLPEPPLTSGDLSELDEEERNRLGVRPLPGSLEEALEADTVVRSWIPDDLLDCYRSMKRTEISLLEGADPKEACERYSRVY